VTDAQISKLLGTTKATISQVRDRTHWNAANIKPVDPVTLGLASQLELDEIVRKAAEKKAREEARKGGGATLKPAGEPEAEEAAGEEHAEAAAEVETTEAEHTPEPEHEEEPG
jgi:hypothetical protein